MPDYNSDREGFVKHKWVVQKALREDNSDGVITSKGKLKYDRYGRLMVNDPTLANEIRTEHPHDLAVTRMRYPDVADRGHRYHFGMLPEMPWKRGKHAVHSEGTVGVRKAEWEVGEAEETLDPPESEGTLSGS
jgi:hypothetical protein